MSRKFYNPNEQGSITQNFRQKRFQFFKGLLNTVESVPDRTITILDIGGTEQYWKSMGFPTSENVHITLLNLQVVPVNNPRFSSVKGDARNLSEYADQSFDIVFSNSVIEHLFTRENQEMMANEIRRVGRNYYVQTPNYYFPIEPHWMFPFFQFLPFNTRVFMTKNFTLGHIPKTRDYQKAIDQVKEVKLLNEKEMRQLFPGARVYKEMFMGMVKSITMYYFPGRNLPD